MISSDFDDWSGGLAQLVVRNLEESVKRQLKKRAEAHGRSLESEVREILRTAATDNARKEPDQRNFGTRFAAYFTDIGVDLEMPPVEYAKPIDFGDPE